MTGGRGRSGNRGWETRRAVRSKQCRAKGTNAVSSSVSCSEIVACRICLEQRAQLDGSAGRGGGRGRPPAGRGVASVAKVGGIGQRGASGAAASAAAAGRSRKSRGTAAGMPLKKRPRAIPRNGRREQGRLRRGRARGTADAGESSRQGCVPVAPAGGDRGENVVCRGGSEAAVADMATRRREARRRC